MRLFATFILLNASFATAECPITIEHVHFSAGGVNCTNVSYCDSAQVQFRNASNKTIVAVKFGYKTFDSVGDERISLAAMTNKSSLKSGKSRNGVWKVVVNEEQIQGGVEVYVTTVLFEDGTKWESKIISTDLMNNKNNCMGMDAKRGKFLKSSNY